MNVPQEYDEIRPYNDDEVKQVVEELLHDRQFSFMLKGFVPWLPVWLRNALFRLAFLGVHSTLGFQKRFMIPLVKFVLHKSSKGATFDCSEIESGPERYTFMSNHRDIVLDSAILSVLLIDNKFSTTCEIGIGDNLLIYPWIRKLVKLNKAFTVRRGLGPRELQMSSQLMSRYMHFVINEKRENIWIAQREGRAKDSNDRTQVSVLKMMCMGYEGTPRESLKHMHIVPLTISYEYDPTDYLKAEEFQQKRDNPSFKKSKQDDLKNMKTGIFGFRGRVHYKAAPCINSWLDDIPDMPKNDFLAEVALRMNKEIFSNYRLYPCNYIALDELQGTSRYTRYYTSDDRNSFDEYVQKQLQKIRIELPDWEYLRERILTMYANPAINYLKVHQDEM